jgi:hypothetical protein
MFGIIPQCVHCENIKETYHGEVPVYTCKLGLKDPEYGSRENCNKGLSDGDLEFEEWRKSILRK